MHPLLKRIYPGKYDPIAYWNSRRNPNNADGTDPARVAFDTDYIRTMVGAASPVLELGPGVGRTFGAYAPKTAVTALDLSRAYGDQLRAVADEQGVELTQLYLDTPESPFPLDTQSFPVGVASQVLLHVAPEQIEHTMSELVRVCERTVIISKYMHHAPLRRVRLTHVFNHDYVELATKLGCELNHVVLNENRMLCTMSKVASQRRSHAADAATD